MVKHSAIDTTGFSPLERRVANGLEYNVFVLALEAERTPDGTLCFTAWSERRLILRHTLVFAEMAKYAAGVALVCYNQARTDLAWRINAEAQRTYIEREAEARSFARDWIRSSN
jgi:hypothetical protein